MAFDWVVSNDPQCKTFHNTRITVGLTGNIIYACIKLMLSLLLCLPVNDDFFSWSTMISLHCDWTYYIFVVMYWYLRSLYVLSHTLILNPKQTLCLTVNNDCFSLQVTLASCHNFHWLNPPLVDDWILRFDGPWFHGLTRCCSRVHCRYTSPPKVCMVPRQFSWVWWFPPWVKNAFIWCFLEQQTLTCWIQLPE